MKEFAYLLFTINRQFALELDWEEYDISGVFSLFLTWEDNVESCIEQGTGIMDPDWKNDMDRIAPIQISRSWDPRDYLMTLLSQRNINPAYVVKEDDATADENAVMYFNTVPSVKALQQNIRELSAGQKSRNEDDIFQKRFNTVLTQTVRLAQEQDRGILFFGGWNVGGPYGMNYLKGKKEALKHYGLKIFSRYPAIYQRANEAEKVKLSKEQRQQQHCQQNVQNLAIRVLMYAMDHDDKWPRAETFLDDMKEYLVDNAFKPKCPACKKGMSYAMNSNLSNRDMEVDEEPGKLVLIYETTQPNETPENSIPHPPRHPDGNIFAFADGHVEVLNAEDTRDVRWK